MIIQAYLNLSPKYYYIYSIILWSFAYWLFPAYSIIFAEMVTTFFTNALKLVSLPVIFLSIVATFAKMEGFIVVKSIFMRVFSFTMITTIISSLVALFTFLALDPTENSINDYSSTDEIKQSSNTYFKYFLQIIPSNIIQPFYENNAIGVLILAFFYSPLNTFFARRK